MRIAVVGAGSHSRNNHGPALKAIKAQHPDQIELAAVCDIDLPKAQAYAQRFGFAGSYDSLEDMLAHEQLDGIVAVTPVSLTAEIASFI